MHRIVFQFHLNTGLTVAVRLAANLRGPETPRFFMFFYSDVHNTFKIILGLACRVTEGVQCVSRFLVMIPAGFDKRHPEYTNDYFKDTY